MLIDISNNTGLSRMVPDNFRLVRNRKISVFESTDHGSGVGTGVGVGRIATPLTCEE